MPALQSKPKRPKVEYVKYSALDIQQHVRSHKLTFAERERVANIVLDTNELHKFTRLSPARYLELRLKVATKCYLKNEVGRTFPTMEDLNVVDLLILAAHLYLGDGETPKTMARQLDVRSTTTMQLHLQMGVCMLHLTYHQINRQLTLQRLLELELGFREMCETQGICWRADYSLLNMVLFGNDQRMLLVTSADHLILFGELCAANRVTGSDEVAFRQSDFFADEIKAKRGQMLGMMCTRPNHTHEIPLSGILDGCMGLLYDEYKMCLLPFPKLMVGNRLYIDASHHEWNKSTEKSRRPIELQNNSDLKRNYRYLQRTIDRTEFDADFHKLCFTVICQMANSLRPADKFYVAGRYAKVSKKTQEKEQQQTKKAPVAIAEPAEGYLNMRVDYRGRYFECYKAVVLKSKEEKVTYPTNMRVGPDQGELDDMQEDVETCNAPRVIMTEGTRAQALTNVLSLISSHCPNVTKWAQECGGAWNG